MKINKLLIAAVVLVGLLSACKSKFNIDFTPDNHYLQKNAVAAGYAATTHPVVLMHGAYGFVDIFGMEYWYHLADILENNGATVYTARVVGAGTSEGRGEQLITQLEDWGAGPYHLFGHSHGGPTIRYAAAKRPDLVASVASVAGANYGSESADNSEAIDMPLVAPIIAFMGNALGHVIDTVDQNHFEQNVLGMINDLNKEGSDIFNDKYPEGLDRDAVTKEPNTCMGTVAATGYSSGTGGAAPVYVESDETDPTSDFAPFYASDTNPANVDGSGTPLGASTGEYHDFVYDGSNGGSAGTYRVFYYSWGGNMAATHSKDPLDGMHKAVAKIMNDDDNDGLVERCSTHLGYVVKDNYPMNHLDFMNWFMGLRDDASPYPPAIFLAHLNHLKDTKGL